MQSRCTYIRSISPGRGVLSVLTRRDFFCTAAAATAAVSAPWALADEPRKLPSRPIPGTDDRLPIIGLGNSNAFRTADMETSRRILSTLVDHGGAYVDCGGDSRFVVGKIAAQLGVANDLFLGTYFVGADDRRSRDDAKRLLDVTGKPLLDLMHNYPEDASPHWDTFRRWKDDGLTRYIGVSRHRQEAYSTMLAMMQTGTVDVLQVNYSLLETEAEVEILPAAKELGVAVTINRPFVNGRYFSLVGDHPLPEWAAEFDCASWAQFSLKFILSHPVVNCVLTETANPKHALDNLGAGVGRLPDEETRQRMLAHVREIVAQA